MPSDRKRPWFLVLALLGALALGMTGAYSGWAAWTLYKEPVDVSQVGQSFSDPADRAAVQSRVEAYLHTLDAAKARGWPIAVATLLLGGSIVLLSMRVLGGSGGARAALVQLIVAQAALNGASYWVLRDVVQADTRLLEAHAIAELHERFPERSRDDLVLQVTRGEARARNPLGLVLSTLGSVLVVIGLTRKRAREYLETTTAAVEER